MLRHAPDGDVLRVLEAPAIAGVALLSKRTSDDDVVSVCRARPDLRMLRLTHGQRLTSAGWAAILSLSDLRRLQVVRSRLDRRCLDGLPERSQLRSLTLERVGLDDGGLRRVCEAAGSLEILQLDGNRGLTADGVRSINRLEGLRQLSLAGCDVDDEVLRSALSDLRQLELVNLSSTSVTAEGAAAAIASSPHATVILPKGAEVAMLPPVSTAASHAAAGPWMKTAGPVLVLFTTPWCTPCKGMKDAIAQLPPQIREKAKFVEVDASQEPWTAEALAVRAVPTVILLREGVELWRHLGNLSVQALEREVRAVYQEHGLG